MLPGSVARDFGKSWRCGQLIFVWDDCFVSRLKFAGGCGASPFLGLFLEVRPNQIHGRRSEGLVLSIYESLIVTGPRFFQHA
jgi:hypothetical protein